MVPLNIIFVIELLFYIIHCNEHQRQNCRVEFNVWQPDADELQRMRNLEIQYANFSNYVDKELLQLHLQRSVDLAAFRNWTIMYEKTLADSKTEQLQKYVELQELRVKVGIHELKMEEMKGNLDRSIYRNQSSEIKKHVRKDRMLPAHASQSDTPRYHMIDSLKNMVTDLKSEWILLKREFIDLRDDNENLNRVQNELLNFSVTIRNDVEQFREINRLLKKTDSGLLNDIANINSNLEHLSMDLSVIKSGQEVLKVDLLATENGLSALEAATAEIRRTLMNVQVQAETVRLTSDTHPIRETATVKQAVNIGGSDERVHAVPLQNSIPKDCADIANQGHTMSGLYRVQPGPNLLVDYAYCEILDGIGYTVFQRRGDGLQDFSRGWLEYKIGFGNLYGDFWAGNDFLHTLTKDNGYGLRIDIWDWEGNRTFAEYNVFTISNEKSRYALHVSGYHGNAGDSLSAHDGMQFSTKDLDNDLSDRNCAADNKGGWWFSGCYFSNLNGAYHVGWYSPSTSSFADGVVWYTLKDSDRYSVRKVEMKLRRYV